MELLALFALILWFGLSIPESKEDDYEER